MSPDERRFFRYVAKSNRCWLWVGARTPTKHPQPVFWADGRMQYAHVWIWQHTTGQIKPPGMQLSPRCKMSNCVRPDHRELRPRGSHRRANTRSTQQTKPEGSTA